MRKKGQAALEFLTTYGWAFLIILVMVGGFAYFGVFDISTTESCVSSVEFTCQSSLATDKYQTITLRNNLPEDIIIHNATLTKNGQTIGTCLHNQNTPTETQFQIYCTTNQTTNKKETLNIQINYYSATGNPSYTKTITTTLKTTIKSATEIEQNGQTPQSQFHKLITYYKFDEGTGTTTYDSSGNNNHGTLINNPQWQQNTNCKNKNCIKFNNSNNTHIRTNSFPINSTTNSLTITLWTKTTNQAIAQTFLGDAAQVGTNGFLFFYRDQNGRLYYQYANGTTHKSMISNNFFTNYEDQWLHIAVVADYSNKKIEFYRNGNLFSTHTTTETMLFPSANRIKYIGSYNAGAHFMNGTIDEFRIYNRALTAQEIQSIYQN